MRTRLSHQQYFEMVSYLKARAPDGKIDEKPGALSEEASRVLGFPILRAQISKAAKENNIEIIFNQKRANGAAPQVDDNLCQRLDRMERKINLIMTAFDVKWVE